MITGDHALTAQAIAKELGITGKTITGDYLQKLSVKELANLVDEVFIYARVSPFHKLNILKALQSKGHIVAMTGDGINDSPALKDADIGIAVNSGSDVAKEVSKMILLDNNFNSIVEAVKEGRGIYDNIKKFIKFLFSCNLAEVMLIFFSLLIGLPLPLIAIQILWMNLVTDGLPAISLGVDPVSDDVMSKKPRKKDERILHNGDIFNVISLALIMCAGTLLLFKLYLVYFDIKYAQTMAFSTMVMFQLFNCFNFRLDRTKKFFSKELFKNKLLITSFFISLILQIGIIYLFSDIFNVVELKLIDWVWITLVSSLVLVFYRTKTWLISKHQI